MRSKHIKLPTREHALYAGFDPGSVSAGNAEYSEAKQAAADGKEGPKKAPPKDERPWLQKNWIFLIPAGMLVRLSYALQTSLQSDACLMRMLQQVYCLSGMCMRLLACTLQPQ